MLKADLCFSRLMTSSIIIIELEYIKLITVYSNFKTICVVHIFPEGHILDINMAVIPHGRSKNQTNREE